jgi:site-specific recombinase XerD
MGAIVPEVTTPGDFGDEVSAFLRSMKREDVSDNTLVTYAYACRSFAEWLIANGRSTNVEDVTRRDIEEWEIAGRDAGAKPATVHNRHRGLQRFFTWYSGVMLDADPKSTYRSPMAGLKPPRLPQYLPRVLTMDQLAAILATTSGRTFEDKRDEALIRLFFSTGVRRAEVAKLTTADYSMTADKLTVVGKGRKERPVHLGDRTRDALDAYVRARRKHAHAAEPWLWLGTRGRLTDSGIAQAIRARGKLAGIDDLHPHDFRHAWRHHAEVAGADMHTLMEAGGWSSDAMLRRYAATTRQDRALEAMRKIGLGDKL